MKRPKGNRTKEFLEGGKRPLSRSSERGDPTPGIKKGAQESAGGLFLRAVRRSSEKIGNRQGVDGEKPSLGGEKENREGLPEAILTDLPNVGLGWKTRSGEKEAFNSRPRWRKSEPRIGDPWGNAGQATGRGSPKE